MLYSPMNLTIAGLSLANRPPVEDPAEEAAIVKAAPQVAYDFSQYADGTYLAATDGTNNLSPNVGWKASYVDAPNATVLDNAKIAGGVLAGDAGNYSQPGIYLLYPPELETADLGPNHYVEVEIPAFATGVVSLGASAVNDRAQANLQAALMQLGYFNSSNSLTSAGSIATNANARFKTNKPSEVTDKFRFELYDGTLRVFRNGCPFGTYAGYATGKSGGLAGFSTYNGSHRSFRNIAMGPLPAQLTISGLKNAYSRRFGLGYENGAAEITVSGTYVGDVDDLQWALFDPETGAPISFAPLAGHVTDDDQVWRWVQSPTIADGSFSGTILVPWGVNGTKPYRLAVGAVQNIGGVPMRVSEGQHWDIFYVTATLLVAGQSNAGNLIFSLESVADHSGGVKYGTLSDDFDEAERVPTSTWEASINEGSASDVAIGALTKFLSGKMGGPVMAAAVAVGAAPASTLGPGGARWDWITTHLGFIDGFEMILLSQGEAEGDATFTDAGDGWLARWRDVNLPAYLPWSQQPPETLIPIYVAMTGRHTGTTPVAAQDTNYTTIRRAQQDIESLIPNAVKAYHHIDIPMGSTQHYEGNYVMAATRAALSIAHHRGLAAHDGTGPFATAATRTGATEITLPVDLNGADSLSGSACTGWVVSASSDLSSPLTLTSVDVVDDEVVITLAADPGSVPLYVASYQGTNPDVSSWPLGNYASADFTGTIGMQAVMTPMVAA